MATFSNYRMGLGNVGSYQVAGKPYLSGSVENLDNGQEDSYEFDYVTKSITVINHTSVAIRVHFASKSNADVYTYKHYVELDSDEDSITMNVKCRTLYVSNASGDAGAQYSVAAELTNIPAGEMVALSGKGIDEDSS